jgi:hypothetical protein
VYEDVDDLPLARPCESGGEVANLTLRRPSRGGAFGEDVDDDDDDNDDDDDAIVGLVLD